MAVFKRYRKQKDGSKVPYWYIRYWVNGKEKWEAVGRVGEVTKAVAQKALEDRKRMVRLGQLDMIGAEIPTLPEFAKEFLSYVRDIKGKRSWDKDGRTLQHLIAFFSNKKLSTISPKDIDDYKHHMLNNGYKPASVNRELACLKYLYNLAIRWKRFFGTNPVSQVEFLEENNEISRILLPEEEEKLLAVCSPYLRNIIITALNTGMRKMEILSLKWEYIDLEGNMITLPQTNTKAKKTRRIPISSALRKALLEQKLMSGGSEFVFPSGHSKNGHLSWLKRSFATACRRAGIKGLRFHDLRHTAATRMIESDISVEKVSKILGHSDVNLTMRRYAHPEDSLRDAVETLANFTLNRSQNRSQHSKDKTT